ncbi:hypothetical protein SUDANB176_03889 [Streptomyces sp. enrichment culture]|uniref:hypothetical protein n=1 Tax=Streptomyces sp. enrichment culture TaxID=1795815 RepID=UPI003F565437
MGRIDFTPVRVGTTADGGTGTRAPTTTFARADGNFRTADGRAYENVYAFRYDRRDGLLVRAEEYADPVTSCAAFPDPGR